METMNTHEYELRVLKGMQPLMRWDGKTDLALWKEEARRKLEEMLGLPLEACDMALSMEYADETEEYTEYRFTVQTEPGYRVPCHLLVPKAAGLPAPLTICLSGHGGGMHVALGRAKTEADEQALQSWPHRAMALRSLREGRCALVIEARSFGECSVEGYGTSCTEAAKIALLTGRTVIGERVWDVMRILDAVQACFAQQIDMRSIVCTGNSGGGTAAYYLACMDERITAAAPSCSVCTYEASIAAMPHCLCNHIPSIRRYFEMGDLAGLIAPRALVIAAGEKDEIFPLEGTRAAFAQVQRMYAAAGAEGNCALVIGKGGHLNYADLLWETLHQMNT